jgi:hypothetical protein
MAASFADLTATGASIHLMLGDCPIGFLPPVGDRLHV